MSPPKKFKTDLNHITWKLTFSIWICFKAVLSDEKLHGQVNICAPIFLSHNLTKFTKKFFNQKLESVCVLIFSTELQQGLDLRSWFWDYPRQGPDELFASCVLDVTKRVNSPFFYPKGMCLWNIIAPFNNNSIKYPSKSSPHALPNAYVFMKEATILIYVDFNWIG